MRDYDIRHILRSTALYKFSIDGSSKIVEEMDLPITKSRIDMAVINGKLHGYEIKSASDTLLRLPHQISGYEKVFDYLTVVTEEKHVIKILPLVPEWVGINVCSNNEKRPIKVYRKAKLNKNKQAFYIAKLLWREEVLSILKYKNIPHVKSLRNWLLCELLAQHITIKELSDIVREKLKARENWKAL